MSGNDHLGDFEQLVLLAVLRLGSGAYGMTVWDEIQAKTGRRTAIGAVYTTLERLETKGFVSSWTGEPSAARGGRAKRFFRIEAPGEAALRASLAASRALADGVLGLEGAL